MKIMLCADLHMDSKTEAGISAATAEKRRRELYLSVTRLFDKAQELSVDAVIIAGDLFDTARPTIRARKYFSDEVRKHSDIDFLYLTGNHDAQNLFLSDMEAGEAVPDNFKTFSCDDGAPVSYTYTEKQSGKRTVICGCEKNSAENFARLDFSPDDNNILVLHGNDATDFAGDNFDTHLLRGKNIDFIAVGHIHKYSRRVFDQNRNADETEREGVLIYPGCPAGRGFDECGEKGFVLISTDADAANGKRCDNFVPLDGRRLCEIHADITGCETHAQTMQAVYLALKDTPRENLVKVVLCGKVRPTSVIDLRLISDELSAKYFFVRLSDETKIAADYADFKQDLSLRGEFVRIVLADKTLSDADREEILRYGLSATEKQR